MEGPFAFIGLGSMGSGLARNLRQKIPSSSKLYIYDTNRAVCDKFVADFNECGPIEIVESPKEAAMHAKVVVSSLPSVEAVRAVYLSETDGCILAAPNANRLILETSTIEASVARELSVSLEAKGAGCYVDTPISGGPQAAATGTLSFMIGRQKPDESDTLGQTLRQVLETMGDSEKLFWCGKTGAGLTAKISNNYIAISVFLAVTEATAIGVRSGIDPDVLHDIIHNSSGQTFMGDILRRVPRAALQSNHVFPKDIMVKDITLGVQAGNETNVNPRMALAAQAIWTEAAKNPETLYLDGFQDVKK
ncbi:hypothetical protein N7457_006878 [Penicillium paradoxum]|uniref:uncharacterized protein n=1 Tax=Penicillium paradoxum TaxID=176176 RepID=UPI002548DF8C|nr:uncharacterized protein N7457_006878 [Penicillium paradoxum]KAJ5779158.1 hypothetical protein N7457_006878 [Penicillium paradoxum]